VVDPDVQVRLYGADTVRAYLMFGYRWQDGGPWDPGNIQGSYRWLGRVWSTFLEKGSQKQITQEYHKGMRRKVHQTLRSVTGDFEKFEFNTVVSALMTLLNDLVSYKEMGGWGSSEWNEAVNIYLRMMAPVTPHIAEELWARLGKTYSIHQQDWPKIDDEAVKEEAIELAVQVNGKVKSKIIVPVDVTEENAKELAVGNEVIKSLLGDRSPKKVIYVPGRLVNIVL